MPHVYAASAAFGFFNASFYPAATGLLPEVVPADRLVAANAPRPLSIDLSGIFGPLLGGALALGQLGAPRRRGVLAYSGVLISGMALVLLSRATEVWQASLVAVLSGGSIVAFSLVWESTLQDLMPCDALGWPRAWTWSAPKA